MIGRLADAILPANLSVAARSRWGGSREPELRLLPRFVHRGDTVVDIGAHRGLYAYRLCRLVGPSGHVHCVEPQPDLAAYLRKGLPAQATIHQVGLGEVAGNAELSIPTINGTAAAGHATMARHFDDGSNSTITVRRLDDLELVGRVTLIKCDVEGHELSVLRGATRVLEIDRPVLILEVETRNPVTQTNQPELQALLSHLRYSVDPGAVNWVCTPV